MSTIAPTLTNLIARLDEATADRRAGGAEAITARVKRALSHGVRSGDFHLPDAWTTPRSDSYARRLLHRDPRGRYSVIAMTWGAGQGTPIHDHAGMWCVECVYRGEISVTSFEICPTSNPRRFTFAFCGKTQATLGEAGALIPPHEYHIVENLSPAPAVTIHVYGGEMTSCTVYEQIDGSKYFRRRERSLSYDSVGASDAPSMGAS